MGKKSKQKKVRKAQSTNQPMQQRANRAPENVLTGANAQSLAQAAAKPSMQFEEGVYVKKDITRIVIILAIIGAVLGSAVVLNSQTDYLQKAGKQLAAFMRLS